MPSTETSPDRPDRVRDLVGVRRHPTVVRFDHLREGDASWITEAFLVTGAVERHLEALRRLLREPAGTGVFLIGQYGSGKSHFLAYVARRIEAGELAAGAPSVVTTSLLDYPADIRLESVISEALGLPIAEGDRRPIWEGLGERFPEGVVLLVDELSEFLRSKRDRAAFNEDVRFLQFVGERAQGQRLWIVAAMQEQIEHAGELEEALYRKIKDRYPIRMLLDPGHVADLVADAILEKRPGYDEAVETILGELREALPDVDLDEAALRRLYPLHPATIELLEEVRDRFSQARGVVDFVVSQLAGRADVETSPLLDEPWGALLTPERIVGHFRDLLEVQPDFLPLAQQVFPWMRRELEKIVPQPARRELAERLFALLVLIHLSPARESISPREALGWLLYRPSRVSPEKNLQIVADTLETLATEGRFVVADGGRYRLDLADEGGGLLDRLLDQERDRVASLGDMAFEELADLLRKRNGGKDERIHPFSLPRDTWQHRQVRWQFHPRPWVVWLGNETPSPITEADLRATLVIRLPWGKRRPAAGCFTLIPDEIELGDETIELLALERLRHRPWNPHTARRLASRLEERWPRFLADLDRAYRQAEAYSADGRAESPPRATRIQDLERYLGVWSEWMLRHVYPAFERFAPTHGPLPREAYRRLLRVALAGDLDEPDTDEQVRLVREAYLVPMGLLRRQNRGYRIVARLEQHELVRLVLPLVDEEPSPEVIHRHLASPVYGLVPDQTALLLVLLTVVGEIDVIREGRSLRDAFETLPDPLRYDRVVPGVRLGAEQLRALETLRRGLGLREVKEWTAVAQRKAAREIRNLGETELKRIVRLRESLRELDPSGELRSELERIGSVWLGLEKGATDLEALRRLLERISDPARFTERASRLDGLEERLRRQGKELQRFRHLLGHPIFRDDPPEETAIRLESLGEPPSLAHEEALERWLEEARELYRDHRERYQEAHDEWWKKVAEHPLWQWKAPSLAESRHLGLASTTEEIASCRRRARERRCSGLVDLDFQPVCRCGYDGEKSPVAEELERFETLRRKIDGALEAFFAQSEVRERLKEWEGEELGGEEEVAAYLAGSRPWPDLEDVALLDRHLAGIDLVRDIPAEEVLELLADRTWEPEELIRELTELVNRQRASRLRIPTARTGGDDVLLAWALEQSLRHAVPLPRDVASRADAELAAAIRPEWITSPVLERLDELGFGDRTLARIAGWVAEGQVEAPVTGRSPLIEAAREVRHPSTPSTPPELGQLARLLYRWHHLLERVAGEPWLERLEALASTALAEPPALAEQLERDRDATWIVLDGLGLALEPALLESLPDLLPGATVIDALYATVAFPTTTDAWYGSLIAEGTDHPLHKLDSVDELLHRRPALPFEDLERLAVASLGADLRRLRQEARLDPPFLLFADHGFRLRPDGSGWTHGGDSTLERVVPVIRLE